MQPRDSLRCCFRYSKDKPRLGDTLEIIKFLCKEFWLAVFKKQVDNLRTNHRVRTAATGPGAFGPGCRILHVWTLQQLQQQHDEDM
jgi:hypothetical protein